MAVPLFSLPQADHAWRSVIDCTATFQIGRMGTNAKAPEKVNRPSYFGLMGGLPVHAPGSLQSSTPLTEAHRCVQSAFLDGVRQVSEGSPMSLTDSQRGAIRELGSRGAGGQFDQKALGKLFDLGLIEVDGNRRLALTELGKVVYQQLLSGL